MSGEAGRADVPKRLEPTPLTGAWIDGWISRVRESLAVYLTDFETRFGYPADVNSVDIGGEFGGTEGGAEGGVEGGAEGGAEGFDVSAALPGDLLLLYRHVRRLGLPDVGVGLFVHSLPQTVAGLRGDLPTRIVGAVEGSAVEDSVVVFGSDGGGALFALSRTDEATVYRLPPGRVEGSVYHCGAAGAEVLAASLQGFLAHVETHVERELLAEPRPTGNHPRPSRRHPCG
ncbi:hypothetical protein [Streptomyces sp. NPDC047525]|uniref:hypothetical protein n=1 Tax=Streptomyces sp. NPDC047525 TaxID=3155264 RepID=UPI0033E670FD